MSVPDHSRIDLTRHLINRLKLYRRVKLLCNGEVASGAIKKDTKALAGIQTEPTGDMGGLTYPSEYNDPNFWGDIWESVIADYGVQSAEEFSLQSSDARERCKAACTDACDVGGDAVGVACNGVAVALAYAGVGAPGAAVVGLACSAGTFIGKYWCKTRTCRSNCGG